MISALRKTKQERSMVQGWWNFRLEGQVRLFFFYLSQDLKWEVVNYADFRGKVILGREYSICKSPGARSLLESSTNNDKTNEQGGGVRWEKGDRLCGTKKTFAMILAHKH